MTYIITKDVKSGEVAVFNATQEQHKVFNTDPALPETLCGFFVKSARDLEASALTSNDYLELFNATRDEPLVKFPSKAVGADRTFEILGKIAMPFEDLATSNPEPTPAPTPAKRKTTKRAKNGGDPVITLASEKAGKVYACKEGSKQAILVDLLFGGVTLATLMKTLGWTRNSTISGIYHDVHRLKGYGIRTDTSSGEHTYHLVLPEGTKVPVPHKPRATSK